MNDNNVWRETTVRVRCELLVFVTDVCSLLQFVVVCTRVCAFDSAAIVVKSAVLAALLGIVFFAAHRARGGACVTVRLVLLI